MNRLKNPEPASYFTISPSGLLLNMLGFFHAAAIAACWLNDLPEIFRLLLSLPVGASWYFQYQAHQGDSAYLRYTPELGWSVSFDGHVYSPVSIQPGTVVEKFLTVLHFKAENRSQTLVILNDAMPANDYRRLIVQLKISANRLD